MRSVNQDAIGFRIDQVEARMDWTGCDVVEVMPGKVSGVPILKHSRVQADTVLESRELGESVEEIAYSFTLNPEDIRKVLSFAAARQGDTKN